MTAKEYGMIDADSVEGSMWLKKAVDRLSAIEDTLGEEYDLDELREMVQAKREGRCVVIHPNSVTDDDHKIICRKINAEDIRLRKMRNAYEKHK
nr:MAG TPA: hypothetical protein [Caudoviricetes sp.]